MTWQGKVALVFSKFSQRILMPLSAFTISISRIFTRNLASIASFNTQNCTHLQLFNVSIHHTSVCHMYFSILKYVSHLSIDFITCHLHLDTLTCWIYQGNWLHSHIAYWVRRSANSHMNFPRACLMLRWLMSLLEESFGLAASWQMIATVILLGFNVFVWELMAKKKKSHKSHFLHALGCNSSNCLSDFN